MQRLLNQVPINNIISLVGLFFPAAHLHSESGVLFCCLVLLGELELALLLEVRTGVALTQDLELGPVGAELLRETPLCGNGVGPIGLLVSSTDMFQNDVGKRFMK